MRLSSTRSMRARVAYCASAISFAAAQISAANAEPASDQFVAGAKISVSDQCEVLTVSFHYLAQYAGHVPRDGGGALTIQLNPVVNLPFDPASPIPRQAVPIENAAAGGVKSLTAEFDQTSRVSLQIEFDRAVTFDVKQPAALDQIAVAFPRPGSQAVCKVADLVAAPSPTLGPIGMGQPASPLPVHLVVIAAATGTVVLAMARHQRSLQLFVRTERLAASLARMRRVQEQLVVVEKLEALRVLVGGRVKRVPMATGTSRARITRLLRQSRKPAPIGA